MNVRVNLAVALAAALSFACGGTPAPVAAPTEGRMVGQYRMDVTPVAGTNDVLFSIVPQDGDGNPNTNPPGKLQIRGVFRATVSAAGQNGNPCGVQAIDVNVTATSFATELIQNLWIRIPAIATGFEACNSDAGTLPAGMPATNPAGRWSYGDLTGAPNPNGTIAGQAVTRTWWFKYPSASPKTFFFDAFATLPAQPTAVTNGAVAPGTALTWTFPGGVNPATTASRIQVCAVQPLTFGGFDPGYGVCPAGSLTTYDVASGTTYTPVGLQTSLQYYWRVGYGPNATLFSFWNDLLFLGPPAVVAPANAASFVANAATVNLEWMYDLTNSADWGTALKVCTDAACTLPVAGFPVAVQQVDPVNGLNTFNVGLGGLAGTIPLDPANLTWLTPGTYYWQVAYVTNAPNAVTGAFVAGTYTATRSFVISPVSTVVANVNTANPAGTMTWTSAPQVTGTTVMLYDAAPGSLGFDNLNIVGASAGNPGVAGTPGNWSLVLPGTLQVGATYWYEIYVNDFFAIDPGTQLPFATTHKVSGSFTR